MDGSPGDGASTGYGGDRTHGWEDRRLTWKKAYPDVWVFVLAASLPAVCFCTPSGCAHPTAGSGWYFRRDLWHRWSAHDSRLYRGHRALQPGFRHHGCRSWSRRGDQHNYGWDHHRARRLHTGIPGARSVWNRRYSCALALDAGDTRQSLRGWSAYSGAVVRIQRVKTSCCPALLLLRENKGSLP